jgi:hypothetical protein
MKLGFTGTRNGMTKLQKDTVSRLIISAGPTEAHMGDCIGADTDFYYLIEKIVPSCKKIGHVPDKDKTRSKLKYDEEKMPKPYLTRDHDIVDESDMIIATPKAFYEELRSGTWATVRYAKKTNKRVILVFPNGSLKVLKEKIIRQGLLFF